MGAQCSQSEACQGEKSNHVEAAALSERHASALDQGWEDDPRKRKDDLHEAPETADTVTTSVGEEEAEESHVRGQGNPTSYFNREVKETLTMSSSAASSSFLERRAPVNFKTGAVYDGQWRGRMRHGQGRQTWADGTSYVGEWKDNQAEGKGCFLHNNGDKYIGQWRANVAHGLGLYYSKDGLTYSGEWFHDMQEGHGVEQRKDEGSTYQGEFRGGLKEGVGVYKWSDGSEYRGAWNGNSIDGLGVYMGGDGRWFKGRWSDSVMHGGGMYVWQDGREYVGQYRFDKKDGFGTFVWPDGRRYEGYWRRGRQHGNGTYTCADGLTKTAQWVDGKRKEHRPDLGQLGAMCAGFSSQQSTEQTGGVRMKGRLSQMRSTSSIDGTPSSGFSKQTSIKTAQSGLSLGSTMSQGNPLHAKSIMKSSSAGCSGSRLNVRLNMEHA